MGMMFCDDIAMSSIDVIKMDFIHFSEALFPRPVFSMINRAKTSVIPDRDIATAKAPSSPYLSAIVAPPLNQF